MRRIDLIPPGEILLTEFLIPSNISQATLAKDLDIPQDKIAEIVQGKRKLTVDLAMRLSVYFQTTVNFWLNLQSNYDIEKAERTGAFEAIHSHVRANPIFAHA